jgi:tetratricopeptide (TPR) repeat protein
MLAEGTVFAGRYRVEAVAGEGGMGSVHRAHDQRTGATVALKVLTDLGPRHARRFALEGRLLQQLQHPTIVRYVDHGVAPTGEPYVAMEWLAGETLAERLRRGRLTVAETLQLGSRIAEALTVAHAQGVIHRDIKPSNLFIPAHKLDQARLIDFGIARWTSPADDESGEAPLTTRTGAIMGTPRYMAPEQARASARLDARADLYSLGCVLFECLTGRAAIDGHSDVAILAKVLFDVPPRLGDLVPGMSPPLESLVARLLAKDPGERPADASLVLDELIGCAANLGRDAASAQPRALTRREQRLFFVVMTAPMEQVSTAFADEATLPERPLRDIQPEPALADPARLRAALRAAVTATGQKLEELADGSAIVTFFGSGDAADQAARAATCARRMQTVIEAGGGAALALCTGMGVVDEPLPIGDVIERAARLLRGAPRGRATQVRTDEVTAGLLTGRFEVRKDDEAFVLAGETEPAQDRVLLGRPTPCLGRDREVANLEAIFTECATEQVARVALVTGPAGIGKSRVRHEFVRRLQARGEPLTVWVARGDPVSEGSPFSMLAQLIRRMAGLVDGETLAARRSKLEQALGQHVGGAASPAGRRISEFLGELVGTVYTDEGRPQLRAARQDALLMGDQIHRAFEDWVRAETMVQPVLLVLEDLHLGDWPTLKLVGSALRNLEDRPLMVLAAARPELQERFPKLWEGRAVDRIELGGLGRRAAEKLVQATLGPALGGTVEPSLLERLVTQAGGNAFYLEELIRAAASGQPELPPSVLAMVQARLDGLHPELRRTLRAASLFGDVFWQGGVQVLLSNQGETPPPLGVWLRELTEHELILRTTGPGRFAGETEFAFRHALVREAAYQMLTAGDLSLGHRLAGQWLEKAGERQPLVLAEHFERGGEGLRSALWYRRAAEQALEANDLQAVLARAQHAVEQGADGEELGRLRLLQAQAHNWRGERQEARSAARMALELLSRSSAPWFFAAAELAVATGYLSRFDDLLALGDELFALDAARGSRAERARILALGHVVTQLFFGGRYEAASERLAWLLSEAGTLVDSDPHVAAALERMIAINHSCTGDVGEALVHTERAITRYEESGDRRMVCMEKANLGDALKELGAYAEATELLREVLASVEQLALPGVAAVVKHNLGLTLAHVGRFDEAVLIEEEAIAQLAVRGDRRLEATSRIYLAHIHLLADDLPRATAAARQAVEVSSGLNEQDTALATLSRLRLMAGDTTEALTLARRAINELYDTGATDEGESLVYLAYVEALEASGELPTARQALAQAHARLIARASRISDEARRATFLGRVPENARLLALVARGDSYR